MDKEKKPFMCTARPNWLSLSTTFFNKEACHKVPIPLYDILSLDEKNMTVRVEPMVSVGDITRFLVPRGYTLAVTLEIADATLGGLGKSYWNISMKTRTRRAYILYSYSYCISSCVLKPHACYFQSLWRGNDNLFS